jgi:hypothetical protein
MRIDVGQVGPVVWPIATVVLQPQSTQITQEIARGGVSV